MTRNCKAKTSFKTVIIAVLVLATLSIGSGLVWKYGYVNSRYGEIVIKRNTDFSIKYRLPGTGTKDDPYRIENRVINTEKYCGIEVMNTSKHFIIQNCYIKASVNSIFLGDVGNGTATIYNNIIEKSEYDFNTMVLIVKAPYCVFLNNTLQGNSRYGVTIMFSSNSLVANNSLVDIYNHGISIHHSENIAIVTNEITNSISELINHTYAISLYVIENSKVLNNTIIGNFYYGIKSRKSSLVEIKYNQISNGSYAGIMLENTNSAIISYNRIEKFGVYGLIQVNSELNNITYNQFKLNCDYAVKLNYSSQCIVSYNNFIDNNLLQLSGLHQAFDNTDLNFWYDTILQQGNYWSDLIWVEDTVYIIDGSNYTDLYPLENPVEI